MEKLMRLPRLGLSILVTLFATAEVARWARALMAPPGPVFLAVGAGHLAGPAACRPIWSWWA